MYCNQTLKHSTNMFEVFKYVFTSLTVFFRKPYDEQNSYKFTLIQKGLCIFQPKCERRKRPGDGEQKQTVLPDWAYATNIKARRDLRR